MTQSWRIPQDGSDWMRAIEKRVMSNERRPMISQASDLLGPGAGPFAVRLTDWNSEEALFTGVYYSSPSRQINSPDDARYWIGETFGAEDGEFGFQRLTEVSPTSTAHAAVYERRFINPGVPAFSSWTLVSAVEFAYSERGKSTGTQPTTSGNPVTVTWPDVVAEDDGDGGAWSVASGVFTIPQTGRYDVGGYIGWDTDPDGRRLIRLFVNGTQRWQANVAAPSTGQGLVPFGRPFLLQAGDTLWVEAEQNGGSLNILTSSTIAIIRMA